MTPRRLLAFVLAISGCGVAEVRLAANDPSQVECGNDALEPGEDCDDGNTAPGDGCSPTCSREGAVCGNDAVELGEECDDGNTASGDGCSATCASEGAACGNRTLEVGEDCDDGNLASGDGCSNTCAVEARCGDDRLGPGETCDDGNAITGDGCSGACVWEVTPETEPNHNPADAQLITSSQVVGGWLSPAGERDCFAFDAQANREYFFEPFTSLGQCAKNIDLEIFATNGVTPLADNYNDASVAFGSCTLLTWTAAADGRYFVCASEYDGAAVATYFLHLRERVCGDGWREGSELCDDGNTAAGDGCSDTCLLELPGLAESEPNNTAAGAVGNLIAAGDSYAASLAPAGDVDCFAFDATLDVEYIFETRTAPALCTADTELELFATDGVTSLAYADEGGISSCSLLFWTAPATGRYFICASEYYDSAVPTYFLGMIANTCGDGARAGAEECDDNNTTNGDGCSSACEVDIFATEGDPNDTPGSASNFNLIVPATLYRAAIAPLGDTDCFAFDVTQGSAYVFETFTAIGGCGVDTYVELLANDGVTVVAADHDGGFGWCSLLSFVAGETGRNYACVTNWYNATITRYYATLRSPECGNTFREQPETCDDGNTASGDGCSATCVIELPAPAESEPNDDAAGASGNVIAVGDRYAASSSPAGDVDCFAFDAVASTTYVFTTSTAPGACDADTVIELFDTDGITSLAFNDEGGLTPCSQLVWTAPGAGRYFLCVEEYLRNDVIPMYLLDLRLQGCASGTVDAGEQCDDENLISGDGCSATCQLEAQSEIEPNDNAAAAGVNTIAPGQFFAAALTPRGDVDCLAFVATLAQTYVFATFTDAVGTCSDDTELVLFRTNGISPMLADDDSGVSPCSLITWTAPSAGRYYVCVYSRYEVADYFFSMR